MIERARARLDSFSPGLRSALFGIVAAIVGIALLAVAVRLQAGPSAGEGLSRTTTPAVLTKTAVLVGVATSSPPPASITALLIASPTAVAAAPPSATAASTATASALATAAPTPTVFRTATIAATPPASPTVASSATATAAPSLPTAAPPTPTTVTSGSSVADAPTRFDFRPLVVIVENHPDSRPQSGLNAATVVYEAVAEFGITRFMAIFTSRDVEMVGPIRSARHYFIQWASEYNGLYAFAGASPQAYAILPQSPLWSIDFTFGEGAFFRSSRRPAPHNLYANTAALRASASPGSRSPGRLSSLAFSEDVQPGAPVTRIAVVYPDGYTVRYAYDRSINAWYRTMVGRPHVDALDGAQYRPSNIIVQFVETWRIPGDDGARVDMATVGSGQVFVFRDGKVVKGRWIKDGAFAPTHYVDLDGTPIVLTPGQTWIQVVANEGDIIYD